MANRQMNFLKKKKKNLLKIGENFFKYYLK